MIDEKKIILMTKLATQDKKYGKEDRQITSYYPEDYRYINNFWTRIGVILVVGIFVLMSLMIKVEKGLNMPENIPQTIKQYILPYGGTAIVILVVYTLFSTAVYNKKYNQAQKRMKIYEELVKKLDEHEQQMLTTEGEHYDSK